MKRQDHAGRRFLLLQGPSSWFFAYLGRALRSLGGDVTRIGFCPGDRLFWTTSAGKYLPYRGKVEDFPNWLHDFAIADGSTDILMLGDGRAHHAATVDMIDRQELKIRVWIIEHGYLRPDLILIEPDGMGGKSTIPHRAFSHPSGEAVQHGPRWRSSFVAYAAMDVAYHMSNVLFSRLTYPNYRAHSGIHPFVEYGGWIGKILRTPKRRRHRRKTLGSIETHSGPLFLFPLQLSQDFQLTRYGTGETQVETLDRVVKSFISNSPPDALLLVKVHPLDNARTDWQSILAHEGSRVLYLDGGNLDDLLKRTTGVVTINSTVGLTALQAGVPTLALGKAIYKEAGLAARQSLDSFWRNPQRPDPQRVADFCSFIRSGFHVPGAFDGPGAVVGAQGVADWLAHPPPPIRSDAA